MRFSSLRALIPVLSIVLTLIVVAPVHAQPADITATDHSITYNKGDAAAVVQESLQLRNGGESDFDGELSFSVDADATNVQLTLRAGGDRAWVGVPHQMVTNETSGGYTTYSFSLSDVNVTMPGRTNLAVFAVYLLEGEGLDRRLDLPTERFLATAFLADGKAPRSDDFPFLYWAQQDLFTTYPADGRDLDAGTTFSFSVETLDTALEDFTVSVRASGDDTRTLTASADGGVPPYSYAWDTDGDGTYETEGQTVTVEEDGVQTYGVRATDSQATPVATTATYTIDTRTVDTGGVPVDAPEGVTNWVIVILAALFGALVMYGLVAGGLMGAPRARKTAPSSGRSITVESRDMLELRKRTQVAALKELELAKKKGDVPEGLYLPLKEELKSDTVRVMREIERREKESV